MNVKEQQLENECKTFNDAYPVGTPVKVTNDVGDKVTRKTRSEAFVMGGHTAMVQLEGMSGSFQLNRCAA